MTQGAQRRFADSSFPPELRLEVMRASVLYHAPTLEISLQSRFDDVTKAASSLFDKQYATDAVNAVLQQTAEQALLETCIFKVERFRHSWGLYGLDFTHSMASLLDVIGAHIHHLEICVNFEPSGRCPRAVEQAARTFQELKLHFPKLKTCILATKIHTWGLDSSSSESDWDEFFPSSEFYHVYPNQAMFPVDLLVKQSIPSQSLGGMFTELFSAFAEKGPGMRRFVRMLQVHMNEKALGAACHYGPLVEVHETKMEVGPHVI
jgi:hypothetical protein